MKTGRRPFSPQRRPYLAYYTETNSVYRVLTARKRSLFIPKLRSAMDEPPDPTEAPQPTQPAPQTTSTAPAPTQAPTVPDTP